MIAPPPTPLPRRILKLGLAVGLVTLIWCTLLPWLANRPAMREHLQWLDDQGIDPSAMYYTELEMMDNIRRNGQ